MPRCRSGCVGGEAALTTEDDGLGQSLAEDLRWLKRFRQVRRFPVPWRRPEPGERHAACADPRFGRFADDAVALADWENRRWIVMERDWHGWPDPPRYVLFVLEGETIWLAADFDNWPRAWCRPWAEDGEPKAGKHPASSEGRPVSGKTVSGKHGRDRAVVLFLGVVLVLSGLAFVLWGVLETILLLGSLEARPPTLETWSANPSLPFVGLALGAFGALVLVGAADSARADRWAVPLFGTGLVSGLLALVLVVTGGFLNALLMEGLGYRQCYAEAGFRTSVSFWARAEGSCDATGGEDTDRAFVRFEPEVGDGQRLRSEARGADGFSPKPSGAAAFALVAHSAPAR